MAYRRRLGICDDVPVRHAEYPREDEAHLVLRERLFGRIVDDRRYHASRRETLANKVRIRRMKEGRIK